MADQAPLKFVDTHNIAGHLYDPPAAHREFKSMIVGLNTCRISHALRENPVICKQMVTEFWNNASINQRRPDGIVSIDSRIQMKPIVITEAIVREALLFGDQPDYPTEYPTEAVSEVITRMGYEGSYPPAVKKLFHPYWRFLIHTFFTCVSGRKGGSDEISHIQMSAVTALIMDWHYNYSKFVFHEMMSNLKGKKKEMFLMYPRFLQMIFDFHYPDLIKSVDTLDMKSMGPNSFGLMKQSRKGSKVVYQGLRALEKFGKFSETEEVVPAVSSAEEPTPTVPRPKVGYEIVSDDDEMMTMVEETTAVQSIVPTEEQLEAVKALLQSTALKPPQSVAEHASEEEDTSLVPRKRRKRDPRLGVVMTGTSATSTAEPTSEVPPVVTDPIIAEPHTSQEREEEAEGLEFDFEKEMESPDRPSGSSEPATQSNPDTSEEIAHILAMQEKYLKDKGKGIAYEEEPVIMEREPVDVHALQQRVFELEQESVVKDIRIQQLEVSDAEKDAKIKELQANMGGLTAMYISMQQKLISKFGDEFNTGDNPVTPAPQTQSVDTSEAIEEYLNAPVKSKEEAERLKRKLLIIKNSDQNVATSDHPDKYVIEMKKGFSDKYGDRSGIVSWGYDADKEMWWVKRKSGSMEYYNKMKNFKTWTKVDLTDLINAPYHNPSNDPKASKFWNFLKNQVDNKFPTMPTAESFLKKASGVRDPHTGKRMVNVMWPATEKVKSIPLTKPFPEGALDDMKFWTYDHATSTVIIRVNKGQYRIVDPRDLLRFSERDIKKLGEFQISSEPLFEAAAKEYTGMVGAIIRTKLWAGAYREADADVLEQE